MPQPVASTQQIRDALALLYRPGDVVELRVPKAGKYSVISGYFDDFDALTAAAVRISGVYAGVYVTLNPCDPALLARSCNRVQTYARDTTQDSQIVERRWLLIDVDAQRPSGISTTDEEHGAAIAFAYELRDRLALAGWPAPVVADSGNGAHLLYRIDLPANDGKLVETTLKDLAERYNADRMLIDTAVFNPARISKLYGTMACKGDSTPDRPHRLAAILEVPAKLEVLRTELLSKPAAVAAAPKTQRERRADFDLDAWMRKHAPDARGPELHGDKRRWVFPECPWRPEDHNSAFVIEMPNGAISAGCQHQSCPGSRSSGNHWTDLRAMREPDYERRTETVRALRQENGGLPEIVVSGKPMREVTAEAMSALVAANSPAAVFIRSGSLIRVGTDENHEPIIEPMSEAAVRGRLARTAEFLKIAGDGAMIPMSPPIDIVRDVMALGAWPFPPLAGVTEAPIVTPSGALITTGGYNAETRLIYMPNGFRLTPIPEQPTPDNIEAAAELLDEVICDFPFEDDASRANALATIITPVIRPMIEGPTPMALFDKPQAGTGASLLSELVALIATGRPSAMLSAPGNDEEWEKRITALLRQGRTVVTIDNIEGLLCAAPLASALTSTIWQGRILGKTEMVSLPQRASWIATGNNVRLGGDLPRRCYWVRMDAKSPRPWQRGGFKHPALLEWVKETRGQILSAILTLVRGWIDAGRPSPTDTPVMGSYEAWTRVVGGILALARIPGFLRNMEDMYEQSDDETPQWEGFTSTWYEVLQARPVTAKEIAAAAGESDPLREAIPESVVDQRTGQINTRKLGNALARRNGVRFMNGLIIKRSGEAQRATQWIVTKSTVAPTQSEFSESSEFISPDAHTHADGFFRVWGCTNSQNSPNSLSEDTEDPTIPPDWPDDDEEPGMGEEPCPF